LGGGRDVETRGAAEPECVAPGITEPIAVVLTDFGLAGDMGSQRVVDSTRHGC